MPKRTDIKSIMIIGAGPIVIGQACEFDYSGAQACKALREEGYRVILVNSNPATIMTDPSMADATYIEPITPDVVAKILEKEKPDALLPTMGGQTALNTALALYENGTLERLGIEMIGATADAIDKAENRERFREAMTKIGLENARSYVCHTRAEANVALEAMGFPVIIRPSFTLGGTGGGVAYNKEEFEQIVASGLAASPTSEVLVEESLLGWKEYEMEVVRDKKDNCIIICSIENVDPMGVHTGDSITVAPAMTLTDKEYQIMRNASLAVLREIGVDTGGSNVQFTVNPKDGRVIVIEMNPRVSRSSALASKATGFPIAKIAAKLAVGYTLDELDNDITGCTPASFEPSIDYVVTKIPRFTFEKFAGTDDTLSTAMKSVGEAMAIGRTFQESLQKGLRSMETGLTGLNEIEIEGADGPDGKMAVIKELGKPTSERLLVIAQAFRHGLSVDEVKAASKYEPWFLNQIKGIVDAEQELIEKGLPGEADDLQRIKKMGFSDERISELTGKDLEVVSYRRHVLNIHPTYKRVDTCAAEFPSKTSYMYSAYEGDGITVPECESEPSDREKVVILGGGPNRIGQGIEFDYCCVHASYALKEAGYETIMVNCNPETVSTDYDTSDRLYFEPLTQEDVIELIRVEQSNGKVKGVIVQYGGQTPLKLAHALEKAGIPILGTSVDAIDLAEDRERFQQLLAELGLKQPSNGLARTEEEAFAVAESIGFPLVIRPSYVLGGRAMEIVHSMDRLKRYMKEAVQVSGDSPVLLDSFLQDAIEIDVDAVGDVDGNVYIAGIMQHIEEAGIHSGDSACSLPPYSLSEKIIDQLTDQAVSLAKALKVVGLMNVQFAVKDDVIYIIEVNPRASRTVPFVAKATGIPVAKVGARVMAGEKLADFGLKGRMPELDHVAVKEAVFPFARFPGVDVLLGPEMKSTGEVMGLDKDFPTAFLKAQMGAGSHLPTQGCAFVSVKERDKDKIVPIAQKLVDMGFSILATSGTSKLLEEKGISSKPVNKVIEGRPHCVDAILNDEVQLVINTTEGLQAIEDSYSIRRETLTQGVPYYTTMAGATAAADAIAALRAETLEVGSLQSYFKSSF
ncbi:carbamoyl-phosphate synthase, large subunit [Candidatus Terasakiella magnetica]|uniref:Carbamoyl phosphate synthase large chain n=1 Tax=Candidatus Terasakiella magnetica TaxID=1867952 RepID=A0A1C3RDJ9_9PROT|nr:carbamoyl-phosphate synthase large subunit [Candidatus Terasakiella magnetica]SCA55373.1 carbamoyl-phosphate synthase, large subunit [Candidatus Terasakiella magnetica]